MNQKSIVKSKAFHSCPTNSCGSEYYFYQEIIPAGFVRLHDCRDDCAVLFLLIELEDVYDTLKTLFITT